MSQLVQVVAIKQRNKPFWVTEISFLRIAVAGIFVTLCNRRRGGGQSLPIFRASSQP